MQRLNLASEHIIYIDMVNIIRHIHNASSGILDSDCVEVELAAIGLNHLLKLAYSSISRYGEELIDCVRQLISSNLDRLNFERIRRCDGQVQIYDRVATVHILAQQLVRRTFGISLGKLLSAELIYLTVADGSILDAVFGSGAGSDGESYDTVTSFRSILGEALVGAVRACYRQVFRLDAEAIAFVVAAHTCIVGFGKCLGAVHANVVNEREQTGSFADCSGTTEVLHIEGYANGFANILIERQRIGGIYRIQRELSSILFLPCITIIR